jgi:uncharacterized membrane protein (UPF0127 family)
MSHGNPGRTFLAAAPALAVCLLAADVSFAGTPAGETGAPASTADFYKPEDAARAFANAGRAVVRMPSGRAIVATVADTPERSMYGYMFKREVKEDEGMVFVYPEMGQHPFWMKNTYVPLDIIWMDDAFTILHVETAAPCKADPCPSYGTPRMSRYTLELKGGAAAKEGLHVGDRLPVSFPGDGATQ